MNRRIKPRRIHLEASSICQLKCPACPKTAGLTDSTIGKGHLDPDHFSNLIGRNPFIREVELSSYGEIFLNPRLTEIMSEAHRQGIRLTAGNGVNLNSLSEEQMDGLVRYRFRHLTVSLDGTTGNTYARYRVNGDFNRVISHIRTINDLKKTYRSSLPRLTWQFVAFGHNEHQIPAAKRMAAELDMDFYVKLSWDPYFSPVRDTGKIRRETGYGSREEYRSEKGIDPQHGTCVMLWENPQINWDGRILGCSRNFWGEFGGNAFSDSLAAAVNSDGMQRARRMLTGKIPVQKDLPCATCQIYRDRAATGKYVNRSVRIRIIRRITRRFRTSQSFRNLYHRVTRKM